MKTKFKTILIFATACLCSNTLVAQTTQSGSIKEYHFSKKKTPLGGVEIQIKNANSTISDKQGNFILEFHTLQPGSKVDIRRIEKLGYEIFNKEALEQWNINPNVPFVIEMVRSDKFKELRDLYSRESSKSYAAQYDKEKAKLEAQQKAGQLTEEELRAKIVALREEYDRQLENIDNYIDRFARIDLTELSKAEQEIITLVQNGEFDKAISRYESLKLIDKYEKISQNIVEIESAKSSLDKKLLQNLDSSANLFEGIKRQLDTYMLQGGVASYENIKKTVDRIMQCPTTDMWMKLSLIDYLKDQDEIRIYESCDLSKIEDIKQQMLHRENYAHDLLITSQFDGAYEQACILLDLAKKQNDIEHIIWAKIIMADIFIAQMKAGDAMAIYNELLEWIDDDNYRDSFTVSNKAEIYRALGGYYQNVDVAKFLEYTQMAYKLYHELCDSTPTMLNKQKLLYSKAYYAIALNVYGMGCGLELMGGEKYIRESIDLLLEVIPDAEAIIRDNFRAHYVLCFASYRTLAESYYLMEDYTQSEKYFLRAIDIYNKAVYYNISTTHETMICEVYNNLGFLYQSCMEYAKSEQAYIKSIDVMETYLKRTQKSLDLYDIIALFRPYINIAALYVDMAKYDLAKQYGSDGLKYCELLYDHYSEVFAAEYVLILKTLALAEMNLQQFDDATTLIDKAIKVRPNDTELQNIKKQITDSRSKVQ